MPSPGTLAMAFDDHDRILCARMNYANHNWVTPGGRVEPDGSPIAALQQEAREESGHEIEVGDLVGVYSKIYADDLVLCIVGRMLSRCPPGGR